MYIQDHREHHRERRLTVYNRRQMLGIGGEEQRDGTITLRGRAHRALTVAWTPRDGRVHVAGGPGHRPSRAEREEIADRIAGAVRDFAVIAAKAGTIIITPVDKDEPRMLSFAQGRLTGDVPADPALRGKQWGYVEGFYNHKNHRNMLRPGKGIYAE